MRIALGSAFLVAAAFASTPRNSSLNKNDIDRRLNVYSTLRWKDRVNDVVQIPYNVDTRYFSAIEKEYIEQSIQVLADASRVIKFIQHTNQASYINVVGRI